MVLWTTNDLISAARLNADDKNSLIARDWIAVNGTATPATSVVLDIQGTDGSLLLSRLTTTQRDALTPVSGMLIYNSTLGQFQGYHASSWLTVGKQDIGAEFGDTTVSNPGSIITLTGSDGIETFGNDTSNEIDIRIGEYLHIEPTDSPVAGSKGTIYFDNSESIPKYHNGTSYVGFGVASSLEGVSNPGANIDFVGQDGIGIVGNDGANTITFDLGAITPDSITVSGVSTFNGDVALGSDAADTITFNGDTSGHITPNVTDVDDLGADALRYRDLWLSRNADIEGALQVDGDVTTGTGANEGTMTHSISAARTWTFPDESGNVALFWWTTASMNAVFNSGVGGSITQYIGPYGNTGVNSTESNVRNQPKRKVTAKRMKIYVSSHGGSGDGTITLRKNSTSTALTTTTTGTGWYEAISDVDFNATDNISILLEKDSQTATISTLRVSVIIEWECSD